MCNVPLEMREFTMSHADTDTSLNAEYISWPEHGPEDGGPARVIHEMVEAGGVQSLQGLVLEVGNVKPAYPSILPEDVPGSKEYVIRSVEEVQKSTTEPVRTILPSDKQKLEDYIPFIYTKGGIFQFGKRIEDRPVQVQTTNYIIDKYNIFGELEEVIVYDQRDFTNFLNRNAKRMSMPFEDPESAEPAHKTPTEQVSIELEGSTDTEYPTVFDELTAKLEAQNIYDWSGMVWRMPPTKNSKTGDTILGYTAEILRETLVVDRYGPDPTPLRTFFVREVDSEGNTDYKVLKDYAIKEYLEKLRDKAEDLSVQGPAPGESDTAATQEEQDMDERTLSYLETYIDTRMERFSTLSPEDRTALWLLSFGDAINPGDEDAETELLENLQGILASEEGGRRVQAVRELVAKYGLVKVYNRASKLKTDYSEAASALELSIDVTDTTGTIKTPGNSVSWVIEGMADRYYFDKQPDEMDETHKGMETGDALADTPEANKLRRDIVAQRLASALMNETMIRKKLVKEAYNDTQPPEALPADFVYIFQEAALRRLPRLAKDVIENVEEKIYADVQHDQPVRLSDLVKLGRALQRSIGIGHIVRKKKKEEGSEAETVAV